MHAYAWLPSGRVLDHKCVLVITNNLTCIVCSYALRPGAYTSPSLARIDDASEHSTPLQRRTNWKKAMALLSDNSIETDPCLIYWSTHKGHVHALQMETPCTNTRSRPGLATVVSAKKDTTVYVYTPVCNIIIVSVLCYEERVLAADLEKSYPTGLEYKPKLHIYNGFSCILYRVCRSRRLKCILMLNLKA